MGEETNKEELLSRIKKLIVGKRIVDIIVDEDAEVRFHGIDYTIEDDMGEITLVLEGGIRIKAWNSEWGGIDIEVSEN